MDVPCFVTGAMRKMRNIAGAMLTRGVLRIGCAECNEAHHNPPEKMRLAKLQ